VLVFIELRIEYHDAGSGITIAGNRPHFGGGAGGLPPGCFRPFPFELIMLRIGLPNGGLGYPMGRLRLRFSKNEVLAGPAAGNDRQRVGTPCHIQYDRTGGVNRTFILDLYRHSMERVTGKTGKRGA
jgi:hypothetical protein